MLGCAIVRNMSFIIGNIVLIQFMPIICQSELLNRLQVGLNLHNAVSDFFQSFFLLLIFLKCKVWKFADVYTSFYFLICLSPWWRMHKPPPLLSYLCTGRAGLLGVCLGLWCASKHQRYHIPWEKCKSLYRGSWHFNF